MFVGERHFAEKIFPGFLLGCDIGGAKELGVIYFPSLLGSL